VASPIKTRGIVPLPGATPPTDSAPDANRRQGGPMIPRRTRRSAGGGPSTPRPILPLPPADPPPAPGPENPAGIEPSLNTDDFCRVIKCGRATFDRMRSAGKIPRPDHYVGRSPRWRPTTVRRFLGD
jgi:hypothetical protein